MNADPTVVAASDKNTQEFEKNNGGKNGELEKQLSSEVNEAFGRPEGASVDEIYERKVYILNKILNDHIGMGKVQWQLFLLSGWGWMADNLWLQGVAIILPQVQREFNISTDVRWMTFSLYMGLICGAATWGILADVIGRRPSFNITLCLAGIFGIAGGGAPNFVGLGGILAALGFGLGGNLPVDGMMFLEFIPSKSQYLLTLLSVFWSVGQLLASLVAWAFIANYSCDNNQSNTVIDANTVPCDVSQNKGWRYTFYTLGALTFAMFICRFFIFRLPESPKFYLSKGRDAEAVAVLKEIARRNGTPLGDDVISVEIFRSAAGQEASMDTTKEVEDSPKGVKAITSAPKRIMHNFSGVKFAPDLSHVTPLFIGWRMALTTSILWVLWSLIGLAYPLYNAFLPIYLSQAQNVSGSSSVDTTYRNYAIISVCGVPGSILAAWMVELPRSGRRGALAIGTLITGVFLFLFTTATNEASVLAYNCVTAASQNIMEVYSSNYRIVHNTDTVCLSFQQVRRVVCHDTRANPSSPSRNRRRYRCISQPNFRIACSYHWYLFERFQPHLRCRVSLPLGRYHCLLHSSGVAWQECHVRQSRTMLMSAQYLSPWKCNGHGFSAQFLSVRASD